MRIAPALEATVAALAAVKFFAMSFLVTPGNRKIPAKTGNTTAYIINIFTVLCHNDLRDIIYTPIIIKVEAVEDAAAATLKVAMNPCPCTNPVVV